MEIMSGFCKRTESVTRPRNPFWKWGGRTSSDDEDAYELSRCKLYTQLVWVVKDANSKAPTRSYARHSRQISISGYLGSQWIYGRSRIFDVLDVKIQKSGMESSNLPHTVTDSITPRDTLHLNQWIFKRSVFPLQYSIREPLINVDGPQERYHKKSS